MDFSSGVAPLATKVAGDGRQDVSKTALVSPVPGNFTSLFREAILSTPNTASALRSSLPVATHYAHRS